MMKISNGNMRALLSAVLMGIFCLANHDIDAAAKKTLTKTSTFDCAADPTWFSSPSMPTEVKQSAGPGDSTFCDFYQFSWQAFAYLMAPSASNPQVRNFEDTTQFPVLEVNSDGTPANSCDNKLTGKTLFVRSVKPVDGGTELVIPERIGQAGGGATLYDQNGNVVYYDVRFGRSLCDINGVKSKMNFPGGTTELKLAWKVLGNNDDPSKFITLQAQIGADKTLTNLGLIGFHMAIATPDHPEFVWATFEHHVNVPDCAAPSSANGWSFTSANCATALQNRDPLGIVQCGFNNATPGTSTTGTPTEICREYPYGSAPTDLKYDENVGDITSLNSNVQPFLTGSYAILKNYFNLGALWVSDPTQSSDINNQRGSLRLANAVMETDFQDVELSANFISNCFGCHNYTGTATPASGKNTTSGSLSHIFDDIVAGTKQCMDVQASQVINSQSQAKSQCPSTCTNSSKYLSWNGQWTNQDAQTGQQLPMTVCGCCGK
jgi:hypothetical protein